MLIGQENKGISKRCAFRKNFYLFISKVWDFDDESGWMCFDIVGAHVDTIWRLSWAHPEFGQLIASCSEDKMVNIWEEQGNLPY